MQPPKVTFQDLQNTNFQLSNESLLNQQTDVYSKIPSPHLPENQYHTYIQMKNYNIPHQIQTNKILTMTVTSNT